MLNKQQKIILVVAGVFVIIVVAVGLLFQKKTTEEKSASEKNITEKSAFQNKTVTPSQPAYSPAVPKDAKPTTPQLTIPLENKEGGKQGYFSVQASKTGYVPDSITVKIKDFVTIDLTSVDGDYDLFIPSYGVRIFAQKGTTNQKTFTATASGTFLFECRDACPPDKKIFGQLIVIP